MEIQLSAHVKTEMLRRHLPEERIKQIACQPEQVLPARNGLECRQSKIFDPSTGKDYLLRVIVNPHETPVVVVTAYKTSKVSKYWRD